MRRVAGCWQEAHRLAKAKMEQIKRRAKEIVEQQQQQAVVDDAYQELSKEVRRGGRRN